ncbi:putative leucine-rich repeat-containing protein DDB_G0290503 [Zophobas morio]|uniref:putative leucine-rich repeat-containing protein DDB_G0290503 n=1 Tax=Zophobas morio TaxID=2755281 RepID=UPI00308295E8
MSENIPSLPRRRSRRHLDVSRLPTPPPDPTDKDDFLVYLDGLQKSTLLYSRSTSAVEDAFDHLDKLYRLMEQMLELREQNARLHRRIRDLEHLNNLEKMHKELDERAECPELDKDTAFAETILESILAEAKPKKAKRQSVMRRNRSGSVSVAAVHRQESRRASECVGGDKKKVSKWTKVKAAFKWEKAAPNVSDAKSQDSGIGGVGVGPALEVARYLRVPSCDEHGHSGDSGAAEVSTPGTLSAASSVEEFHRGDARHCSDPKSSDDEHSHNYIPHSKEGSQKSNKSHKTPWAKMKDIIQTRNSFKKKHRLSAHSDDVQIDVELCSDEDNVFEEGCDVPPEVVARYRQAAEDGVQVSKWTRVKKAFLPDAAPPSAEEEVQANYKQLQKKLSLEFQEKLGEWERMRQNSPSTAAPPAALDDAKDPAFIKKMEEWQKIKAQPSLKKPPMTSSENLPPEFRKKLQEWEKIRKGSGTKKKLADVPRWKSLSGPKSEMDYQNLSEDFRKKLEEWKQMKSDKTSPKQSQKQKKETDKELQWFEKELTKIEKEKQRLERERQKFLEREESLSKLRNSVVGGLKKEVLIHTPSGFYRFEGISRKFTQKLYEWEKAQGIGPESSTFALLNSSLTPDKKDLQRNETSSLVRSKSADSIAISALNLTCPLMSHQPSSLSLNDVEELEKECLDDSRSSSEQFISSHSHETLALDEPEALIVEIEDIVEETAEPLHPIAIAQKTQQPIYQRQEAKLCEGETCAAPKIRRSESTRAQSNYNLIEEIFSILKNLQENEVEIQKIQEVLAEQEEKSNSELIRLKMFDESQKAMSIRLCEKVTRLQEANARVFSSLTKEEDFNTKQVLETLETVQDLSSEIYQLTEKLDSEINERNVYDSLPEKGACSLNPTTEVAKDIKNRMLELRRRLSYVCAASDLTAPRRRQVKKNEESEKNVRLYVKNESTQSQGAIKKRIRYRQKRRACDTDEEEEDVKKNVHRKVGRSRSVSENSEVVVDEAIVQKVVVPTQSNILNVCLDEENKNLDSPVTVFVKTTRKLFTPLVESGLKGDEECEEQEDVEEEGEKKVERKESVTPPVTHLPPLPSPLPVKKAISPSIRLMMAKYNQKVSEDSHSTKSGNSSGSASPLWLSPPSERRVRSQTERYQEELKRSSPRARLRVHKSHTVDALPTMPPSPDPKRLSSELRLQKLHKAKEEFLNAPASAPPQICDEPIRFPARNRLSQISVDSETSYESACGALIKSASAGMINVDAEVYRQIDPEVHGGGYVSLPRNTKRGEGFLGGRFGLASIASKFRKVKMRRGKDKEGRMGAVSALCRQSLVVDIQPLVAKEEETKSGGWIKKAKLFKK